MKTFLAVYTGSPDSLKKKWNELSEAERQDRERRGMADWGEWVKKYEKSIKSTGSPLGKTKRVDAQGVRDITNLMAAYTVVEAESHDAAAKMFLEHPHFTIFPGDAVEIMECLPIPNAR